MLRRSSLALLMATSLSLLVVPAASADTFRYGWVIRGPIGWLAGGLRFPNSGVGELTQSPANGAISTSLRITSPKEPTAAYIYESEMSPSGDRTFTSHEGYDWRGKTRHLRAIFDFAKGLLHLQKRTSEGVEEKVKALGDSQPRDFLTGIQYLRANATAINAPIRSHLYSGGKAYPVLFVPAGTETLEAYGARVSTREFKITAAPGSEDRYPGEVHVWISDDIRRLPVRIELKQSMATLRLDLRS